MGNASPLQTLVTDTETNLSLLIGCCAFMQDRLKIRKGGKGRNRALCDSHEILLKNPVK